jgi:hypothetical protein
VSAPTCPYCGGNAVLIDSAAIYNGRSYGPVWACEKYPACDSYVGCHPRTTTPLGRLADPELREAKKAAHAAFDSVWKLRLSTKRREDPSYRKGMARGGRYKRLAELMGIDRKECRIGKFDIEQCRRVVDLCKSGALA